MEVSGELLESRGVLADAVAYLMRSGAEKPRVLDVGETDLDVVKLVVAPDLAELVTVPRREAGRTHTFYTLDGFLGYLNSAFCPDQGPGCERIGKRTYNQEGKLLAAAAASSPPRARAGVVFVDMNEVRADLAYGEHVKQTAVLELAETDAFLGLRRFARGVGVKDGWRLLVTDMDGTIAKDLAAGLSSLRVRAADRTDVDIDATGLSAVSGASTIKVTWSGAKEGGEDFQTDWAWRGRIWRCFDQEFTVACRLELDNSDGLKVYLHPRGLNEVLEQARVALAAVIGPALPKHMRAFEGALVRR